MSQNQKEKNPEYQQMQVCRQTDDLLYQEIKCVLTNTYGYYNKLDRCSKNQIQNLLKETLKHIIENPKQKIVPTAKLQNKTDYIIAKCIPKKYSRFIKPLSVQLTQIEKEKNDK